MVKDEKNYFLFFFLLWTTFIQDNYYRIYNEYLYFSQALGYIPY
jgi:hypothetical protein